MITYDKSDEYIDIHTYIHININTNFVPNQASKFTKNVSRCPFMKILFFNSAFHCSVPWILSLTFIAI